MSASSLGQLAKEILDDLQASASTNKGPTSRRALNRVKGQILIINKKRFMTTLGSLVPQIRNNQKIRDQIWETFSTFAGQRAAKITQPGRLQELMEVAYEMRKQGQLQKTDVVFYVNSYGVASRLKSSTLKRSIKLVFSKLGKQLTDEETANLAKIGGQGNKFGAQLGHSELTKSGQVGIASSAVRVAAAKEKVEQYGVLKPDEAAQFKSIITKYERDIGLTIDHVMVVKDGKIKKEYVPVLSWQDTISNQELAQIEAAAMRSFQTRLKDVVDLEGSPTLKESIESVILHEISSGVKRAPKKVKGSPKKSVTSKGKGKKSKKIKGKKTTQIIRDNGVPGTAVKGFTDGKTQGSFINLNNLIGPINKELSKTVKKNMVSPRLQNRTGRFANSVKITDINRTTQGFPSIGYTYQRAPYDKFETDPDRDPRKLIDRSIREIAVKFAIGRFYTRRQ